MVTMQASSILGLERLFMDEAGNLPLAPENILPDSDGSGALSEDNVFQ